MKTLKTRTKKIAIGAAVGSLLAGYAAFGAASAFPTNDDEWDCPPCPWYFTLPNGSCMIQVFCGPR